MEIINILGNNNDIEVLLKFSENFVTTIRFHLKCLPAALVIKFQYYRRVLFPSLRRSNVFHPKSLPKAVGVTESRDATLLTDTSAGKYYEFFHVAFISGNLSRCDIGASMKTSSTISAWMSSFLQA